MARGEVAGKPPGYGVPHPSPKEGPSVAHPDVYRALRRGGATKAKAARISNARGHAGGKRSGGRNPVRSAARRSGAKAARGRR